MAIIQTPSIRTVITGDGITSLDNSVSFTLSEKLEATRLLKDTDGSVLLDYSYINTVKSFYFYSVGTYTVTLTVGTEIIPIEVNGTFRLDPTPAFRDLITSIALSTSSTTDISISVRVYGN